MDSLTHVVLGGCLGVAASGKKLGNKALVFGAVAQSLPDIDFVASFWLDPARDLLAHRGITHSFLFVVVCAPALAYIFDRLYPGLMRLGVWAGFFGLQIFVHIFLDAFNAYGVAWLEPFSQTRISFNALFVVDPFLTIPVAAAFGFLALAGANHPRCRLAAHLAWIWAAFYMSYGVMNKLAINKVVTSDLARQRIAPDRYMSTPTPLNTWLWYVVANTPEGSYIGFCSVFDQEEQIAFEYFPRNEKLLAAWSDKDEMKRLKRFSEGYYTAEQWGDTLVFNDLRFGQVFGWRDRRGRFVFHYFLSHPDGNKMVVQRGRFAGWDGDAVGSFLRRIAGENVTDRGLPDEKRK